MAGLVDPLPSKVASADEHEARAAEGSHQSVAVSLMAGASYGRGRSEHERHSLPYSSSVHWGVKRSCLLSP